MTLASPGPSQGARGGSFHRIRFTPLRDVVRGCFSGPLDVDGRLAAAGLPASVEEHLRVLLRSTRLTRVEKAEALEELIVHFEDARDAGVSEGVMLESFGDAKCAGRLIGRACRRQRPMAYHVLVRSLQGCGVVVVLLAVLFGVQWVRYMTLSPSPSVDYLQTLNADALACAEEDRAWPLYRSALLSLSTPPMIASDWHPRPGDAEWSTLGAYVESNQYVIEELRAAAQKPELGIVLGFGIREEDRVMWPEERLHSDASPDDALIFGVMLPHLGVLRQAADLLVDDAMWHASKGDGATVAADLVAIVQMASQMQGSMFLIGDLVSYSILQKAASSVPLILTRYPDVLSASEIASVSHALSGFEFDGLRGSLDGERLGFLDVLQHSYTDDGNGDGRLTREGLALFESLGGWEGDGELPGANHLTGPAICAVAASRRELIVAYDELMALMREDFDRPLWQRDFGRFEAALLEMVNEPLGRTRYHPLVSFVSALDKAGMQSEFARMRRDATLAVLRIHLHRERTGSWPESLEVLEPAMALPLPVDQFDGAPLRYVVGDGEPRLYSIGTDRTDQGGQRCGEIQPGVPETEAQRWRDQGRSIAGDWVFYPAQERDASRWIGDREPNSPLYSFNWLRPVEGLPASSF